MQCFMVFWWPEAIVVELRVVSILLFRSFFVLYKNIVLSGDNNLVAWRYSNIFHFISLDRTIIFTATSQLTTSYSTVWRCVTKKSNRPQPSPLYFIQALSDKVEG